MTTSALLWGRSPAPLDKAALFVWSHLSDHAEHIHIHLFYFRVCHHRPLKDLHYNSAFSGFGFCVSALNLLHGHSGFVSSEASAAEDIRLPRVFALKCSHCSLTCAARSYMWKVRCIFEVAMCCAGCTCNIEALFGFMLCCCPLGVSEFPFSSYHITLVLFYFSLQLLFFGRTAFIFYLIQVAVQASNSTLHFYTICIYDYL